jgi:hypothetical protein
MIDISQTDTTETELLMLRATAKPSGNSDGSSTCSDLTFDDSHNSSDGAQEKRSKVLKIPHEWIHGALPSDKEYGRWIRSQLSENEDDDDEEMTMKCWNINHNTNRKTRSYLQRYDRNYNRDNDGSPWKSIQGVVMNTFKNQNRPAFLPKQYDKTRFRETRRASTLELSRLSS